jgi:hypothetical protein
MEGLWFNKVNAEGMRLFGLKKVDTFLRPLAIEQLSPYIVIRSLIGSWQACPDMKPHNTVECTDAADNASLKPWMSSCRNSCIHHVEHRADEPAK